MIEKETLNNPTKDANKHRMARFFASLRFRLLLLILLSTLPALGLTLATGLQRRALAANTVKEEALRLTRLASKDQDAKIEGAHQLLVAIAQIPQVSQSEPGEASAHQCSEFLAKLVNQYPNYSAISVAEPDGTIYCSSKPLAERVSAVDRDYIQKVLKAHDFTIGEYTYGRVSQKPVLPFAFPVLDSSNQVRKIIIAALDLNWLQQIAKQVPLPEESSMLIVDSDGSILTRFPDPDQWMGKKLPEAPIIQAILQKQGESTAEVAGVDGKARLYAFTPLQGGGQTYVSIGIPTTVAYAGVNQIMVRDLVALGIVAILALIAAWLTGDAFILRKVNVLLGATNRLQAGDFKVRTGIQDERGELGQLAAAFDRMAQTLQEREEQLRQAAGKLERSNLELQDFAYIASHDLQEPLRKIQAFGDRLVKKYGDGLSDEGREVVLRMRNDAERMQSMINDLLAYSRVTSKGHPFAPVYLKDVAEEAAGDLEALLQETSGKVEIGELPLIVGDRLQIKLLLQNLIGNALKFHKADIPPLVKVYGKILTLPNGGIAGVGLKKDVFQLMVEDNGIGFDEKYLDRIFEPFQRLHSRGVYEGSGIGLAICRKIVERHNGSITAKSSPGVGTIFIITLPVEQAEPIESDKRKT